MARCPSLWMWIASLIHLVGLSGSLSITDASTQLITWFSCRTLPVRADLLYSAEVLEHWLLEVLVKARLVFDSTSVLCSCNLTPSFLPVSPTLCFIAIGAWDPVHTFQCLLYLLFILWMRQNASESLTWFHGTWYIVFSHDPSNSLRSSLYAGNHHWWSRLRLVLTFSVWAGVTKFGVITIYSQTINLGCIIPLPTQSHKGTAFLGQWLLCGWSSSLRINSQWIAHLHGLCFGSVLLCHMNLMATLSWNESISQNTFL